MTSIETLMRDSNSIMDPKTDFSAEEIQAFDLLVRSRSGSMDVQELTNRQSQRRSNEVAGSLRQRPSPS
jgi:hypothetical protein